jgi:plastocyanin
MTSIHPHWQETDGEQEVPVRTKAAPASSSRVSRAPAAVVGILLMIGIVAVSFGGMSTLIGQLTNPTPDVTITLTREGPEPASVTIKPGQVIRFVSDDQIPHVLSSDSLPTSDGKTFTTPGMYAGNEYFYTVPASATDATHSYISETNPSFGGTIVVSTATPAPPTPAVSSAAAVTPPVAEASSSAVPLPLAASSSSVTPSPRVTAGVIAVNPYVVGGGKAGGGKAGGGTVPKQQAITKHTPGMNAGSGPESWIAIACAAAALGYTARKALQNA